jgi:5'-3' exonuclease
MLLKNYLHVNADALFFDFNSLIHKAAQKVYHYGDYKSPMDIEAKKQMYEEYLENPQMTMNKYHEIFVSNILEIVEKVIAQVNPSYRIFIAVDGVVPESKMIQQRQRRYKSAIQSKENINPDDRMWFDSNAISPGTPLMNSIHQAILRWIEIKKEVYPEIVYSSHLSMGEGEHKIFSYLRGQCSNDIYNIVIYGLDTDLIMLSLLLEGKNIFLMRESYYRRDITEFISIDEFKKILDKDMGMRNAHKDFVLIIYLIGNDFVPHIPALEDRGICIDVMIDTYKELGIQLHQLNGINWENLSRYISALALKEEALLIDFSHQEFKFPLEVLMRNIHQDTLDYDTFRKEWYYNAFKPKGEERLLNYFGKELFPNLPMENLITDMCAEYCSMIAWMFKYYNEGLDHVYFNMKYPYYHTPLLYDLAVFLESNILMKENWISKALAVEKSVRILPFHQLLYILPPESGHLLPPEFQGLMQPGSPLYDYYPKSIIIELQGKRAEYESVIYVPVVDTSRIVDLCSSVLNTIPIEAKSRILNEFAEQEDFCTKKDPAKKKLAARVAEIKRSFQK